MDDSSGAIVVLLDTSPASEAALSAAARLAHHRNLELVGLFIEEQDLLYSAAYPFAREISALSGTSRPFDTEILRSRLGLQRRRIERQLQDEATLFSLRWRLHVETGSSVQEVLASTGIRTEILLLGKTGWSGSRGRRLGSSALQVLSGANCTIVLWEGTPWPAHGPVQALITDSASGPDVALSAAALARVADRPLHLLFTPGIGSAGEQEMIDALGPSATAVTVERLSDASPEALRRSLRLRPDSELVIGRTGPSALGCELSDILSLTESPVAVVPTT
ncbi:universal stress protein [Guyparkeria sp.]|uniref:universal stress protein n=1 Tax=Guyparkeria sp. TaxID=2035736 RepID=UPI003970C567